MRKPPNINETNDMKKITSLAVICLISMAAMSCQTSYDAYGNPQQTVDPGAAVAGAAAAGILGYAISNNRNDNNHYYHNNNHYRHGGHGHGRYRRY